METRYGHLGGRRGYRSHGRSHDSLCELFWVLGGLVLFLLLALGIRSVLGTLKGIEKPVSPSLGREGW